ncbi:MAG: Rne/Rng family ribonuclease [Gammaproteobacteria bacterium]|jgi:ribonuclease E|nr:Rne/Rng family ribonuclease [Gammaproteobacteria bacterium]
MKRMLFNATHSEELRVAIVDGQRLLDLDVESAIRNERKGNIYTCIVTKVEPSLEAAFVDYGAERQGFLPLKEISRSQFKNHPADKPMAQVRIQDVIHEGQQLLVQVEKDERGNKGAALTTFISLAGRYLVLMPDNPKGGGISRRIAGDERSSLREAMDSLDLPSEHALIARTAGIGKSAEELQWDLDFLLQLWKAIDAAAKEQPAPLLVYQESNLIVRAIRDYLRADIAEIIIDQPDIYERAKRFMAQVMPQNLEKLKHYQDTVPLFSRYQIENQIENAYSRTVNLKSGGAVVLDHTEALITVDVNSARSTRGSDIEETALQTNLEAVDELARQLRIRDLGGLVVVDLIDMSSTRNRRTVEDRLQEAIKPDRARIQIGHISRFGLLEMSRQRLRSSISEANYQTCSFCSGTGNIRNVTSSALSFLRIVEEEALKENTEAIFAELPLDTATFILNEKRHELLQIESSLGTRIAVLPSADLHRPQYRLKRLRSEELDQSAATPSHELELEREDKDAPKTHMMQARQRPAVRLENLETSPPPKPEATREASAVKGLSLFAKIRQWFTGPAPREEERPQKRPARRRGGQRRPNRSRTGNRSPQSGESKDTKSPTDDRVSRPPRSNQRQGQSNSSRPQRSRSGGRSGGGRSPAGRMQSDHANRGNQRSPERGSQGQNNQRGQRGDQNRSQNQPRNANRPKPQDTGRQGAAHGNRADPAERKDQRGQGEADGNRADPTERNDQPNS